MVSGNAGRHPVMGTGNLSLLTVAETMLIVAPTSIVLTTSCAAMPDFTNSAEGRRRRVETTKPGGLRDSAWTN